MLEFLQSKAALMGFGLLTGLLMGLTGAGGGILAVPMLVFGLGIALNQANPIALSAVFLAATIGAFLGLKDGVVRYRAAAFMGGLSIVTAPLGTWLSYQLPTSPLQLLFATALLLSAVRIFKEHFASQPTAAPERVQLPCQRGINGKFDWNASCARYLTMTGASAGLLAGLLGVGGGFILVPALKKWTDLDQRQITATSLAVIALASLSAVIASFIHKPINNSSEFWVFPLMAVIGMFMAQVVSPYISTNWLRILFAIVCLMVALIFLYRGTIG